MSIETLLQASVYSSGKRFLNPQGSLSLSIPPRAIAAAKPGCDQGDAAAEFSKKGSAEEKYIVYSPEQRAEIGRYAVQHGVASQENLVRE